MKLKEMMGIFLKKYFKNEFPGLNLFRFLFVVVAAVWIVKVSFREKSIRILGFSLLFIIFIDVIVLFISLSIEIFNVHTSLQNGEDYHFLKERTTKKHTFHILGAKNADVKKAVDYMDNRFLLSVFCLMLEIMVLGILIENMIHFDFILESTVVYFVGLLMMLTMIYRVYLTIPNIVIFSLPLAGIGVASIVDESCRLNTDETNLVYICGMMIISIVLTTVIGLVSPRILLKQVASQYGTFFVLMLTLFGTIVIKYLAPVILYRSYPQLSPDFMKSAIHENLTQIMISKGFDSKLVHNEGIRQLEELVSDSNFANNVSTEFAKVYDYIAAYVVIASTNVTLISMILKRRGKVGLSMIKDTLIDDMTYEQLQKLAVQGDEQYVNAIWTSRHARDTIYEHEMKL